MKKKFVLEFDEMPKLIFISRTGTNGTGDLYVDGKRVLGIRRLTIRSGVDEIMTHEIEFATCAAEVKEVA